MTTQNHVKRNFPRVGEASPVPCVAERCVRSSVTICYATSGCSWYIPQLYVNSGLLQGTGPTAARHLAASRGLETSRAGHQRVGRPRIAVGTCHRRLVTPVAAGARPRAAALDPGHEP